MGHSVDLPEMDSRDRISCRILISDFFICAQYRRGKTAETGKQDV